MVFIRSASIAFAAAVLLATPAVAAPSQAGVVLIRQANLMPDGSPAPVAERDDGKVTLWVYAAPGTPAREVRLGSGSGRADLDRAAMRTVKRWRSLPPLQSATPGEQWIMVQLVYDARPTYLRSARR